MKKEKNLALIYSAIGHALMHMFAAFYFVIVLAIEKVWLLPYEELLKLWVLGSLLVGLAAIPAGWLSDRWSRSGMMLVMFLGLGISSLLCGISYSKTTLFIGLTFLGLFCAIYHPVAIAWVINSSKKKGRALGINGIFGVMGIGLGGIFAGFLIEFWGWQMAFIVPAVFTLFVAVALGYHIFIKKIALKNSSTAEPTIPKKSKQLIGIALIMLVSIFCLGLVFQLTQTAVPKLLEIRFTNSLRFEAFGVGGLVAIIYGVSGLTSVLGGFLADRYPLKPVYSIGILLQAPLLFFAAQSSGIVLVLLLLLIVAFNTSVLPAENMLLASFTPHKYHGLIYGCKFILAFGAGPAAVLVVSKFYEITREFVGLFFLSSFLLCIVFLLAIFLPTKKPKQA